ncbi:MAG TPA: DinB family protein [Acidimicrobiales bacterium]
MPDDKNWTWVLERACPECGFDAATVQRDQMGSLIRENATTWVRILSLPTEQLQRRSSDDRWSPLEYACHVRDVFVLFRHRLELMLTQDNPTYPNWDQDETAVAERYNEQDPGEVSAALSDAAEMLAQGFNGVSGHQWDREGTRSDGSIFQVDSFGRYLIHDPIHHVYDVGRDLPITG